MPVQTRPTAGTIETQNNLVIGQPFFEFARIIGGIPQPFRELGIIEASAIAKEIEEIELESAHSGIRVTLRELITKVSPTLPLTLFNWAAANLQFSLGSETLTTVVADAAAVITNELVETTDDALDFVDLKNSGINAGSVVLTPAERVDEELGSGDGAAGSGAVSGDFALAFKVNVLGDVTAVTLTLNAVDTVFTPIAVGTATAGNEVEVVTGRGALSGNLQFFVGGGAANVNGALIATYEPSFTLVEGLAGGALEALKSAQSDDGGVFTDETTDANSSSVGDVTLTPATPAAADAFYVGASAPFDRVRVVIDTPGVDYTVVWEYSADGTTYTALSNVSDETNGFLAAAGTHNVSFDVPADWVQSTENSVGPLFYVRARVASVGTPTGATGTQLWTSLSNDYQLNLKDGTVQVHHDADKAAGYSGLIAGQPLFADYTYARLAFTSITPFTQPVFSGRARVRLLTSVGGNLIWNIPSVQMKLTGDEVAFTSDAFSTLTLEITLIDDPVGRFGVLESYTEIQAGNA